MLPVNLNTAVRRPAPGVSVIDVQGEINAFAEEQLMEAYGEAIREPTRTVILNMTGLEYMNSSGIGLLVMLLVRANRQGQRMVAVGLSEHYRNIFELTRLNGAIQILDTEEQALAEHTRA